MGRYAISLCRASTGLTPHKRRSEVQERRTFSRNYTFRRFLVTYSPEIVGDIGTAKRVLRPKNRSFVMLLSRDKPVDMATSAGSRIGTGCCRGIEARFAHTMRLCHGDCPGALESSPCHA